MRPARGLEAAGPAFRLALRACCAGLALESAASLLPGAAATLARRVLDDLDQMVRDIGSAAFKPRIHPAAPPPDGER